MWSHRETCLFIQLYSSHNFHGTYRLLLEKKSSLLKKARECYPGDFPESSHLFPASLVFSLYHRLPERSATETYSISAFFSMCKNFHCCFIIGHFFRFYARSLLENWFIVFSVWMINLVTVSYWVFYEYSNLRLLI